MFSPKIKITVCNSGRLFCMKNMTTVFSQLSLLTFCPGFLQTCVFFVVAIMMIMKITIFLAKTQATAQKLL